MAYAVPIRRQRRDVFLDMKYLAHLFFLYLLFSYSHGFWHIMFWPMIGFCFGVYLFFKLLRAMF